MSHLSTAQPLRFTQACRYPRYMDTSDAWLAQLDQMLSGLKDLARLLAAYDSELWAHSMAPELRAPLLVALQTHLLTQTNKETETE